ncbi:hypothetical protein [Actinomadura atramentaria]|uniref:hypothetical protein n=1 Tax=Actinomadura atramentaria TaxID=1990 RepID=UPI0003808177|nr:hypothetical protein [Actinomadura atramentaria]
MDDLAGRAGRAGRAAVALLLAALLLVPGPVGVLDAGRAPVAAGRRHRGGHRGGRRGGHKGGGRGPIARPLRMGLFKPGKGGKGAAPRPPAPKGKRGAPHEHPTGINGQKQKGHVRGTPQYENRKKAGKPTSTWAGDESFANHHTYDAWYQGTPDPKRPRVRTHDYGPDHVTGYSPQGQPQHKVRVHMDDDGTIHGHPK